LRHIVEQNVGGPSSSFGIWHEQKDQVKAIVAKYGLKVIRIHTHIGSGSDPVVWQSVTGLSLGLVEEFPDAVALNLGGGYKVGRMSYETSTDLLKVGAPVKKEFEDFAARTGRKLKLEIEPGTFLVANAGTLLCSVQVRTKLYQEPPLQSKASASYAQSSYLACLIRAHGLRIRPSLTLSDTHACP
jgi:diaminopimelate decarboxylase